MTSIVAEGLSDEVLQWMQTASPTDIGSVVELGFANWKRATELLSKKISVTQVALPVQLGQVGEDFIETILKERFKDVMNVANSSKSGDLSLFIQHRKIAVEVKNYTNPVPTSGVVKFQRDLLTTNADGGVFISLRTPITGVTTDFTIRYESTETKTIPTAYIVSSDKQAIITTVNMVSQLISSLDYVAAEIYSNDKLIGNVYDISASLEDLTRVRHDLQETIGNIQQNLYKVASGVVGVESSMRKSINDVKSELFHTVLPNLEQAMAELASIPNFNRCSPEQKKRIGSIMRSVHSVYRDLGSMWKLSAKKCTNAQCGITIHFSASKTQLSVPLNKINPGIMINAFSMFGRRVSADTCLNIDIDDMTHDFICDVIIGCKSALEKTDEKEEKTD